MMSNVISPSTRNGDARLVRILLITGFVLLLFAMMNYVSLTIAQSTFRMREMAMRRLLGEHKKKVTWRILSESVLLSLFCMVVALWIAYALLPIASRLLYQAVYAPITLHLSQLFASPVMVLCLVLFVVVVGVVTGLFPSLYIAKVQPIEVVRGTITRRTKMLFSKLFITVQNVISITLIAVSLTM
jgi:putative ABC transport system permease protein